MEAWFALDADNKIVAYLLDPQPHLKDGTAEKWLRDQLADIKLGRIVELREVGRCRDCAHWGYTEQPDNTGSHMCREPNVRPAHSHWPPDGFCSRFTPRTP